MLFLLRSERPSSLLVFVALALLQPGLPSLVTQVLPSKDIINISAWGSNSLRIRIGLGGAAITDKPGALISPGSDNKGARMVSDICDEIDNVQISQENSSIRNGNIAATVSPNGLITISRVSDGVTILRELFRKLTSIQGGVVRSNPTAYTVAINNSAASCQSGNVCCLDVDNWQTRDHSAVAISNCHWGNPKGDTNQRWEFNASTGFLTVVSCGKCLTVNSIGGLEIDECVASEAWSIPSAGEDAGQIHHMRTKQCLSTQQGVDGSVLRVGACNASDLLQQWTIRSTKVPSPPPPSPPIVYESFASTADEKIFGFGEHQQGHLDNKGMEYDMEKCLIYGDSHGGEVCLPFILGATDGEVRYGFLWNMPNYGGVSFSEANATTWSAQAATQIDYFVAVAPASALQRNREPHGTSVPSAATSAAASIMHAYVDAVGHAPLLPAYAAGYWHSKNRYATQADLLAAAQGFHDRQINVSVIVIDYMHWVHMGDYAFDPAAWPDVPGMMRKLTALGMKVMVSAWPFQAVNSTSIRDIASNGWAVTVQNSEELSWWDDNNCHAKCYLYDPTQADARSYIWSKLKSGYYDHGIKIFWLDASEPEISTSDALAAAGFYNNSIGTGQEVGMMYPYFHTRTIHDGLIGEGETDVVMLTRSAWAVRRLWCSEHCFCCVLVCASRCLGARTGHAAMGCGSVVGRHPQRVGVAQGLRAGRS
eukprot:m.533979 g.533979  ORF g.533979 m.533979 type:complete len:708 (+) comp22052_c0_seq29:168-2291(+)